MAEQYPIVCIYDTLFMRSSTAEHLGHLHLLAVENNADMNLGCHLQGIFRVCSVSPGLLILRVPPGKGYTSFSFFLSHYFFKIQSNAQWCVGVKYLLTE